MGPADRTDRYLVVVVDADRHETTSAVIDVPLRECPWDYAGERVADGRFLIGVMEYDAIESQIVGVTISG